MTPRKFDIDNLKVATPCPVPWDTMRGDDRKRFCDMCNLNVYNISEMTKAEAADLLNHAEGRVCGKIYRRADGTVITKDCPVGLRTYRKRMAVYAGAALSMVLGFFSAGYSQCKIKDDSETVAASKLEIEKKANVNGQNSLSGVIADSVGQIIPKAKICLFDPQSKVQVNGRSDKNGKYRFEALREGTYILIVRYDGFKVLTVRDLKIESGYDNVLRLLLEPGPITVTVGTLSI